MRLELPNLNTKVEVFLGANHSWDFTVDPAAQFLQVVAIGAGGGGGSGRQGPTGTIRGGGNGGAGGGYHTGFYPAYVLTTGTVYAVWAGTGGAGGAPVTDADTYGNDGAEGLPSQFADLVRVEGGVGGSAGFDYADGGNVYRPGPYNTPWPGGGGGISTNTGSWHDGETRLAGGGGGGGGWWRADELGYDGGLGGWCAGLQTRTGPTDPGASGVNQPVSWPLPSSGGGGGQIGPDGGGDGGLGGGYGGGGGGGGGATNGTPSGAGGTGGNGIVVAITYF